MDLSFDMAVSVSFMSGIEKTRLSFPYRYVTQSLLEGQPVGPIPAPIELPRKDSENASDNATRDQKGDEIIREFMAIQDWRTCSQETLEGFINLLQRF